ncbi:glutamine synthetase family protein [Octadecabacter ascidiaceicola]|uniref:Gamma-glutamylputrescine synthetase PuuA n=1 Tax=Octadecabacter ascidiaceicola TaxID=1655543 RepID=A0A238K5F6_9RHOB|nr:glutamine synthetase family protein [Octadecabacter ascidiaceicola]SMX37674.1 Gamma-glutamylputrescine synthetase PuuA [Octadecabacter ascidiaceicola]
MTWLHENPDIKSIRVAASDLNGVARGKRIPTKFAQKIEDDGSRFPLSVLNLDIWGEDIENSPLVFEAGDPDGVALPTERGFMPMPWLESPSAFLPMWMHREDGTPFDGDPRHALAAVLKRYADRGLTPICGTELEFYVVDDSGKDLQVVPSERSGKRRPGAEILSLRALDGFDNFFSALYDGAEAMDIPAETAISEAGLGQFEINLSHSNAMKAADDTWLFKLLVRGMARKHGFAASFMAKPYPEYSGNGMHVHFSVLDADGNNIFDNGGNEGTDVLHHAIAGCMNGLSASALILAPHGNSYDRLVPNAHAPTSICWAYENRTAAIRVPGGSHKARRIEHRVAGGDVNPYLMLAAVLGAALTGIEDGEMPPPPITGNAYDQGLPQLPGSWDEAINSFETDERIKRIFPTELIRNLVATKRQELQAFADLSPEERINLYLDTV